MNNLIDEYKSSVNSLREDTLNKAKNLYLNRYIIIPNCYNNFYFKNFVEFKQRLIKELAGNTNRVSAKITIIKPDSIIFNSRYERLLATTMRLFNINLEKRWSEKTISLSYQNNNYNYGDVLPLNKFTEYIYSSDIKSLCDTIKFISDNYSKKFLYSTSFSNMSFSKTDYFTTQEFIDSLENDFMEFLKG